MKRSTILSLSAFAFLLGISSSAFATRVIISDPPETTPIFGLGEAIPVTWDDCATDDVCAGFVNFSGNTISSLIFQFTATDVLDGQTLDCDAEGIFSFNSCGSLPTLQSGQTYTFRFWGGSIPSGITPDFVGGTESPNGPGFQVDMTSDGLSTGNAPDMTMTPVPEPGELGVFGLGLALIGLGIGVRRRWR